MSHTDIPVDLAESNENTSSKKPNVSALMKGFQVLAFSALASCSSVSEGTAQTQDSAHKTAVTSSNTSKDPHAAYKAKLAQMSNQELRAEFDRIHAITENKNIPFPKIKPKMILLGLCAEELDVRTAKSKENIARLDEQSAKLDKGIKVLKNLEEQLSTIPKN